MAKDKSEQVAGAKPDAALQQAVGQENRQNTDNDAIRQLAGDRKPYADYERGEDGKLRATGEGRGPKQDYGTAPSGAWIKNGDGSKKIDDYNNRAPAGPQIDDYAGTSKAPHSLDDYGAGKPLAPKRGEQHHSVPKERISPSILQEARAAVSVGDLKPEQVDAGNKAPEAKGQKPVNASQQR